MLYNYRPLLIVLYLRRCKYLPFKFKHNSVNNSSEVWTNMVTPPFVLDPGMVQHRSVRRPPYSNVISAQCFRPMPVGTSASPQLKSHLTNTRQRSVVNNALTVWPNEPEQYEWLHICNVIPIFVGLSIILITELQLGYIETR